MPDSPQTDSTFDPTLTKLLEVDSGLAAQEAELTAQLESLQAKRNSLKTVLGLFASTTTPSTAATEAAATSITELEQAEPVAESSPTTSAIDEPAPAAQTDSASKPRRSKKSPSPGKTKQSSKPGKGSRAAKQAENWQQYVKDEFRQTALPEVVSSLLQQRPNEVFEISAVVEAIFDDEMPPVARGKARDRISNILSTGARNNQWHRSKQGRYSLAEVAKE